jgi:sn-glycerol 3-phosphate transport system permease protein
MSTREIFDGRLEAALLLLPTVAISVVFLYYPTVLAVRTSFYDSGFGRADEFVGLENYRTLLTDPAYHWSVLVSVVFAALVVVCVITVSLYVTFLVNEVEFGQGAYLVAAIWPYALPPAVAALVFLFVLHPTLGVLTGPLEAVGVDLDWFNDGRQAFVVVLVAMVWKQIGYNVIFMVASMSTIPDALTETAKLDGVGRLSRLLRIYVPMMTPTLFFLVVINTIYAFFSTFAFVDLLTGGGPSNATNVLIFDLYREGFSYFNFGMASTKSVLLFVVVGALTYVQFRLTDEYAHYGA